MRTRGFFEVVILLILIFSMLEVFQKVTANPFTFYTPIKPEEGTIPPSISISSPENGTYNGNIVAISLNVSKPYLNDSRSSIIGVYYTIDNYPQVEAYSNFVQGHGDPGISSFSTVFNSTYLPEGTHVLQVAATGAVLKDLVPKPQGLGDTGVFYITGNSTTYFTVGTQPAENNSSRSLANSVLAVIVVLTTVVALITLLVFKKPKSKPLSPKT
jgi:hypothetical protein